MTLLLKQIFGLLKALNSDTGENQIAAGIACGLILGFAPFFSLQTVIVILLILLFRVQLGAALAASFFFGLMAFILDPVFHQVGVMVLEQESLRGLFTTMYQMPIIPFTKFYNSIAMGSLVLSIGFFPFAFIIFRLLIKKYRQVVVERFSNSKFWKVVKSTSLYKWYAKYNDLYGN